MVHGTSWTTVEYHVIKIISTSMVGAFLRRGSIACYAIAKRCTSYRKSVLPSDRLSVTVRYCVKTTQARIMGSSLEDSPMTLVSSCLTAARNSKGNLGSEAAE